MLNFLRNKGTREVISFVAAGVVAIATGSWAVFTYFVPSPPPAEKEHAVSLSGNCSIIGTGSIVATNVNLTCGPTEAEIKAIVARAIPQTELSALVEKAQSGQQPSKDFIDRLAKNLKVDANDVEGMIRALSKKPKASAGQLADDFAKVATEYVNLSASLDRLTADDPNSGPLRKQATDALRSGDLDRANMLISAALYARANITIEGGLKASQPGLTAVPWNGPKKDVSIRDPSSNRALLVGTYNNPGVIDLNRIYTFQSESDAGFQISFEVPIGINEVQFQFRSDRKIGCWVNFS